MHGIGKRIWFRSVTKSAPCIPFEGRTSPYKYTNCPVCVLCQLRQTDRQTFPHPGGISETVVYVDESLDLNLALLSLQSIQMVRLWWIPFLLHKLKLSMQSCCITVDDFGRCQSCGKITTFHIARKPNDRFKYHLAKYEMVKRKSGMWNKFVHGCRNLCIPLRNCVWNDYTGHWYLILQHEDIKEIRKT